MNFKMRTWDVFLFVLLLPFALEATQDPYVIYDSKTKPSIVYDKSDPATVKLAAEYLAGDFERVTGYKPAILTNIEEASGFVIIIGTAGGQLINQLQNEAGFINIEQVKGKWETFGWRALDLPLKNISRALVITGSDKRGTAYGVFRLSEKLGVHPWYYWADVPVESKSEIVLDNPQYTSEPPSVKYRGVYLNDTGWGLSVWMEKAFGPDRENICYETNEKIFELFLRLKVNYLWAIRCAETDFHGFSGALEMADKYGIVNATSHASPVFQGTNVPDLEGPYDYQRNTKNILRYWEESIEENAPYENVYTIGMRGQGDLPIIGDFTERSKVEVMEEIVEEQRKLLSKYIQKPIQEIPQALTPYKEVLDIYKQGMKVPDDVTIIWPEDNYGYIKRLSNTQERQREGGSGVYYHVSYWGRPHDYLWLNSTHPALIWEEMQKAYQMEAEKTWVLNVGDIKPHEYNISLFMDMAYDIESFKTGADVKEHFSGWHKKIFGEKVGEDIAEVKWTYFDLSFERKPEFMGWSQVEPTTLVSKTAYSHINYGDQAQQRINAFNALDQRTQEIKHDLNESQKDAFFQLIEYPVRSSAYMNKKFLYRDKSFYYAQQHRSIANDYSFLSRAAYDSIAALTRYYNQQMSGGKWNGMMYMKPRDLPVFQAPFLPRWENNKPAAWGISPESFMDEYPYPDAYYSTSSFFDSPTRRYFNSNDLPVFYSFSPEQQQFIDIFIEGRGSVDWSAETSHPWIQISEEPFAGGEGPSGELDVESISVEQISKNKVEGRLSSDKASSQQRLWVRVDWSQILTSESDSLVGQVVFSGEDADGTSKEIDVDVIAERKPIDAQVNNAGTNPQSGKGPLFVEKNGAVVIYGENYHEKYAPGELAWKELAGVGHTGASMRAEPFTIAPLFGEDPESVTTKSIVQKAPRLTYNFQTFSDHNNAKIQINGLPIHPLTNRVGVRMAVSVDGGPLQLIDLETHGRSEQWKQNVLRNSARGTIEVASLEKGTHKLNVYALDPGVVLDWIEIDLGGMRDHYLVIPETKAKIK